MISVSVDGFFEGPGRDIGWHLVDDEVHRHFNEVLGAMGAFLDGRITHELMAEFWPTADADPAISPPIAEFARIWRDMPKIVYSRTLDPGPAEWNTTIVREVLIDEILELKAQSGGDLAIGGPDVAKTFAQLGLIDEYRLYVHPVVIGQGTRLFGPSTSWVDLRLVETRAFGNGVVLLRYQRS